MKTLFLFIMLGFSAAAHATSPERIVFNNQPIDVLLQAGQERAIEFPEKIQVGLPAQAMALFDGLTYVDNQLFLTLANDIQDHVRLIVRGQSGTNYIINVRSVTEGVDTLPGRVIIHRAETSSMTDATQPERKRFVESYPALTRYAMQALYAPERLVNSNYAIGELGLNRTPMMNFFRCTNHSTACRSLRVTPVAGWQATHHYVTALEVENISNQPIEIDPRLIRTVTPGALKAATSMHGRLLSHEQGDKATTILVIIHTEPFEKLVGIY
ncbi:hypothetical protein THIAE_06140 [Thiomicrospira aerophila AL3]|uniref:Integrating conjugative element protein n=1 Tax=Thiomicrospira aerophila AL3 TaxID=717772 RepID=W0DUN1_9GAMM|nr:DUF3438 family protein [Thiomicrospira aerophila]AHF02295.1 hypothetical protein THIAE_06140 [Thiomicrospira aerophila AL3]